MLKETRLMWAWWLASANRWSRTAARSERGATTLEWILIAAGVAAVAIAAVAIIREKVLSKANSIPTD